MLISPKVARWYVVYTKPRHEKKVQDRLISQGIEAYVPLQKKAKKWSDRVKWVEEPMIRSYAFVKIIREDYVKVLQTSGVVCYVYFLGKPASIPDNQIQTLKKIEEFQIEFKATTKQFKSGQTVEILDGALKGIKGELVKIRGKKRILLRIDYLTESMLVDIAPENLRIVDK